jgi:DNA (cytosine-5)-methyltransferase 1
MEWQTKMKPPYKVPSMQEIEALPWNGYNVVSTFSGAGGSCLGYRMAGYHVLWANEFIPEAQDVYKLNHPNSVLNTDDIRAVNAGDILDSTALRVGEIDILDGSPPCASFSTAGKRDAGWGEIKKYSSTKQRVDDLFFEYARLLKGLQPKVFVAENVSGLVKGVAKGYFKLILQELKDCGYNVKAKVLDASWLGVPQRRQRLIFIGVRNDIDIVPVHSAVLGYQYNTADALPHIKRVKHGGRKNNWRNTYRPHPTITQTLTSPTAYLSGGEYVTEQAIKDYRRMTIEELLRVQGFPDDFQLMGSFNQRWERIARTVPPVMMYHIAKTIEDKILCKIK